MTITCPQCGGGIGEACCNGESQYRFYFCSNTGCGAVVWNPKWDKVTKIDGYDDDWLISHALHVDTSSKEKAADPASQK
jgi:hypothetical protein